MMSGVFGDVCVTCLRPKSICMCKNMGEPTINDKQTLSLIADMVRNEQQDEITLASAYWRYIENVLKQHGEEDSVIAKCGHHYKAAFLHGWKHAKEDAQSQHKGHKEHPCNDCAQLKQGGGVDMTKWQSAQSSAESN